jgi:hypothetical protein
MEATPMLDRYAATLCARVADLLAPYLDRVGGRP